MLFNSYLFLLLFLPLLLCSVRIAAGFGPRAIGLLLLSFSCAFYAVWGLPFLALLGLTVMMNYGFALALASRNGNAAPPGRGRLSGGALLCAALLCNVLPLLWFKYSDFLVRNIAALLHVSWDFQAPGLPPGISFCTFIQIAWLVGIYRRQIAPEGLARHALFSCFFPYVLSGPIVRYEQMGGQLDAMRGVSSGGLARGLGLFSMGLAKKTLVADSIAPYADMVFNAAAGGGPLGGGDAWLGSFCYSFQLYFDFSGYTDMALGLALMLGLRLPENFNSPYKATGIIDFWHRWHITLSSWLRDFLYIPLGGNRAGRIRQYRNLFLTMLVGGIWHGAGWTFMLWGALHGGMLAVNHFFRTRIRETRLERFRRTPLVTVLSTALTFLCVNACWVVFRADSLEAAGRVLQAMLVRPFFEPAASGTASAFLLNDCFQDWRSLALLAVCAVLVWAFPSSHGIFRGRRDGDRPWLSFSPSPAWATGLAFLAFASLLFVSRESGFLYFQF